ncbi:T9SS type A sorting domain-containing protein [Chryseobacterium sp. YIM B08800]|uniref:T9SS type A sorting domain-containing protein n=1 Tax=Chryseobacterium sp. YIM B08800 TaxID=2984136 RepID=UPI00223F9A9F|nr:T9SS type A sorting domain-containing protein [Chryseobacterium sp. YIM B08800]
MNKNLFLSGYAFLSSSVIFNGKKSRKIWLILLLMILMMSSNLKAQTSFITIPGSSEDGAFLGPYSNTPRRFQLLIHYAPISLMVGNSITSISFSLQNSYTNSWPSTDTTFGSYEIYISNGVNPANMQMNFAANITGTQTMVKSGSLTIPAGSVPAGNSTNPFSYTLVFDTPYLYNGGNLLIEIRHTGNSNPASIPAKAIYTNSTSYGNYISACWEQGTNVTLANFSHVRINSEKKLGVQSVTIDNGTSVYPNPVKDILYVKSPEEIDEFHVFDLAGRKVFSQKNSSKLPQLKVSSLTKGNYILQIIDKDGNSTSTKFVKD